MARYVATADATVDGITFPRGSILNIPTSVLALNTDVHLSNAVPRVQPAGLEFDPLNYQAVALLNQIGLQQSTQTMPDEGTIQEPVLPDANTPYD
jgi:hypothetical protein